MLEAFYSYKALVAYIPFQSGIVDGGIQLFLVFSQEGSPALLIEITIVKLFYKVLILYDPVIYQAEYHSVNNNRLEHFAYV